MTSKANWLVKGNVVSSIRTRLRCTSRVSSIELHGAFIRFVCDTSTKQYPCKIIHREVQWAQGEWQTSFLPIQDVFGPKFRKRWSLMSTTKWTRRSKYPSILITYWSNHSLDISALNPESLVHGRCLIILGQNWPHHKLSGRKAITSQLYKPMATSEQKERRS